MRVFSTEQVSLAATTAYNDGAVKKFIKGFRSDLGGQVDYIAPDGTTAHSITLLPGQSDPGIQGKIEISATTDTALLILL